MFFLKLYCNNKLHNLLRMYVLLYELEQLHGRQLFVAG